MEGAVIVRSDASRQRPPQRLPPRTPKIGQPPPMGDGAHRPGPSACSPQSTTATSATRWSRRRPRSRSRWVRTRASCGTFTSTARSARAALTTPPRPPPAAVEGRTADESGARRRRRRAALPPLGRRRGRGRPRRRRSRRRRAARARGAERLPDVGGGRAVAGRRLRRHAAARPLRLRRRRPPRDCESPRVRGRSPRLVLSVAREGAAPASRLSRDVPASLAEAAAAAGAASSSRSGTPSRTTGPRCSAAPPSSSASRSGCIVTISSEALAAGRRARRAARQQACALERLW